MALANLIYQMARNSQIDEENKRNAEIRLAAQMRNEQKAEQEKIETDYKKSKVEQGYRDLAMFDQQISETDLQKNVLEQSLSRVQDPMEVHRLNVEIRALGNRSKSLERMRGLREAMLPYEMVDAGIAKAKAVDLVDAANGLRPQKDTGMATVRRENVIGYDENEEPIKETVTFKVPYTQVAGQAQQENIPSYAPINAGMSTYQANNPMLPNITADQAMRDSQYISSGGSVMFSPNQPEIFAPAQPAAVQAPTAPTPMQSSDEKARALDAYSRAQTPEGKERIRQAAAARGIQIP